jgi:hypothetical protein
MRGRSREGFSLDLIGEKRTGSDNHHMNNTLKISS